MSSTIFNLKELEEKRMVSITEEEAEEKELKLSREAFIKKIENTDNTLFAIFLIKFHNVEEKIIKEGKDSFPKFHLGISAFSNTVGFNNDELKKICLLKQEYKKLGSFENDYFKANDYDSSTPAILFTDLFIEEKLMLGFEQLGFTVDRDSYFKYVAKTKDDEYYRPFKISLQIK